MTKALLMVLVLGIGAFIGCAGWSFRLAQESAWPHTRGTVDDIKFQEQIYERRKGNVETYQDLIAIYRYKVGERQYQAAENFGSNTRSQQKLKIGDAVDLRYDPNEPVKAYIATDNTLKLAVIVGVASVICLAASAAAGLLLLRDRKQ